jgi:L-gulonate 5-dehydrogenase
VLVETMSIALHATARAAITADDSVVVLGAGPVGMGILIAATTLGARVMMLDRLDTRLALAREIGAERTARVGSDAAAEISEWTNAEGPTVVVEAAGAPAALEQAIDVVAPSGTVLVVGLSRADVSFPMVELTRKELTIVGSRNSMGMFAAAVELVRTERERIVRLVSHHFRLEDAARAFELAHHSPGEVEKVIIDVSASSKES